MNTLSVSTGLTNHLGAAPCTRRASETSPSGRPRSTIFEGWSPTEGEGSCSLIKSVRSRPANIPSSVCGGRSQTTAWAGAALDPCRRKKPPGAAPRPPAAPLPIRARFFRANGAQHVAAAFAHRRSGGSLLGRQPRGILSSTSNERHQLDIRSLHGGRWLVPEPGRLCLPLANAARFLKDVSRDDEHAWEQLWVLRSAKCVAPRQ